MTIGILDESDMQAIEEVKTVLLDVQWGRHFLRQCLKLECINGTQHESGVVSDATLEYKRM